MAEEEDISIDEIRLWSVSALKDFLRTRNLKVSGRKDELVALVFAAKKMPQLVPPATSQADKDHEKAKHFEDILKTPTGMLPDPKTLTNWISEGVSITKWPPTMAFDIGKYLTSIDDVSLRQRLMSDYKDKKAYSYFACGWMEEVQYHAISEQNKFCFLRTRCKPSQRIRDEPWNVWVAVDKKSGEIQSAFCECFAGYSSTCNHVAALLFKVDFAWRNGLTNPACTSKECTWSAFKGKQSLEPKRISEMDWSSPKHSRQASFDTAEGINPKVRRLFKPLSVRSNESPSTLESLTAALYPGFKDACAFQTVMASKMAASTSAPAASTSTPVTSTSAPAASTSAPAASTSTPAASTSTPATSTSAPDVEEGTEQSLPDTLPTIAAKVSTVEEFTDCLPIYTDSLVSDIETATRGQAENETWHEQRVGRVTGSVAHQVLTRGRKLIAKNDPKSDNLIKRISGQQASNKFDIPALKYGRELEGEARKKYTKQQQSGHRGLAVKEGGLFVDKEKIFLAASPDGLVSCKCCGDGLVEIKCPFSVAHTSPSVDNVSFMKCDSDGTLTLQKSHPYYSQVQFQMGIIKRSWCDFFVYTRHGSMTCRIDFDEERWQELVHLTELVFKTEIAKELVAMHSS